MNRILHTIIIYINIFAMVIFTWRCFNVQNMNFFAVFVLMLLGTAIYLIYHFLYKKIIFLLIGSIVCTVIFVVVLFIQHSDVIGYFINDVNTINNYLGKRIPVDFIMLLPWLCIVIPVITIVSMALIKYFSNTIIIFNTVFIALLWFWNYKAIITQSIVIYGVITVATYILNEYVYRFFKFKKENIQINLPKKNVITCIILFAVVLSAAAAIIPGRHKGIYASNIYIFFNPPAMIKNIEDSAATTGVSGIVNLKDVKIGGKLTQDNTVIFKVKTDKPRYLKADIKNLYMGNGWSNEVTGNNSEDGFTEELSSSIDYTKVEGFAANMDVELNYMKNNNKKLSNMTIYVNKIKLGTLFMPYFTEKVDFDQNVSFKIQSEFTYAKQPNSLKEYSISYYDDNICNFDDAVKEGIGKNYNNGILDINGKQIQDYYYDNYFNDNAISHIDENVQQLASDIVGDSQTNIEKITKIRDYLRNNYKYSLNTLPPDNNDPVKRFLFDEKKGYCVHFASAMTLLCKSVGIPAQYVEGVRMSNKKDKNGLYVVTNSDAHAWTEVLLDPTKALWCIVDCTPDARETSDSRSASTDNFVPNSNGSTNNSSTGTTNKDVNKSSVKDDNKAVNKEKKSGSKSKNLGLSQKINIKNNYTFYLSVIGAIILFIFIIRVILLKISKRKTLKAKSIIPLYLYALKRLETIGIKKSAGLSDNEFVEKIQNRRLKKFLKELVQLASSEYYGNNTVETDKQAVYKRLEQFIRNEQNVIVYYLKKLIR